MKCKTTKWPKRPTIWVVDRVLHVSIQFTWDLPIVQLMLRQRAFDWERAIVGGPAVKLMPDYFSGMRDVGLGDDIPGVLQIINPMATRTTAGCIRACEFCGVPLFDGRFREMEDWPDLPVICDNNLLAASIEHFDRVINRLRKHDGVDFNQGLDARLLNNHHAKRLAELKGLKNHGIRLALDSMASADVWAIALERLRSAGIAKRKISSYAIVGFNSGPSEAWSRCGWIESRGVRVLPMWFHRLDQLQKNIVTAEQKSLGWNDYERRLIMQWFYQHKRAAP